MNIYKSGFKIILMMCFFCTARFSLAQNQTIKYIDYDSAMTDLKTNGTKSTYFNLIQPGYMLYLNCESFDFITKLYDMNKKGDLKMENYCDDFGDERFNKRFDFDAKSLKQIFDDEQKTKSFLEKGLGANYEDSVKIDYPIYIFKNQAQLNVYGSFWSTSYKVSLVGDKATFTWCTGAIE